MSDNEWYSKVALALSGVLLVALLTGLALGGAFAPAAAPAPAPASRVPSYLYLTVTTSAATDYDTYYPANVTIPHDQLAIITITSYDPGVNPVASPFGNVIGTVGGTANYSLGESENVTPLTSLPSNELSHTFTVTLPGSAGSLLLGAGQPMINVPVPVSPNGITPSTVTFTVLFPNAGTYAWRCVAPCDPYSMSTPGFMSGSIYVS